VDVAPADHGYLRHPRDAARHGNGAVGSIAHATLVGETVATGRARGRARCGHHGCARGAVDRGLLRHWLLRQLRLWRLQAQPSLADHLLRLVADLS
jgi:hypothetical protein